MKELKKHAFVISPVGGGVDTHGTWEALLAGCIPIVPKSQIDSMFDDLPVWLVESWKDVTDEAFAMKIKQFKSSNRTYNWSKIFAIGWKEEFYKGLSEVLVEEVRTS